MNTVRPTFQLRKHKIAPQPIDLSPVVRYEENPGLTPGTTSKKPVYEMTVLLVKFAFNNPSRVPKGIPEKARKADYDMDRQHAQAAGPELGLVSAVRPGRTDTGGKPKIEVLDTVQARLLRKALSNAGMFPHSAHWFQKFDGKITVVIEYALPGHSNYGKDSLIPAEALGGIRALSRCVWQNCWVYENTPAATGKPTGTFTMNFTGLLPETAQAKNMFTIRDGHLVVLPFEGGED
jgi:hypothetical protein